MIKKRIILLLILASVMLLMTGCLVSDNTAPVASVKPIQAPTATPVPSAQAD